MVPAQGSSFATTRWSLVLAAGRPESEAARQALAALCSAYWYPVYAFLRRQGEAVEEAQDLTQAFFCRLLDKNALLAADRSRGRFRSFLLAGVRNFLANERDRAAAQKRGGDRQSFSLEGSDLDLDAAERRYALEPVHELTAERLFERRWALTVLERTLARLAEEQQSAGRQPLFERLRPSLSAGADEQSHAEIAAALDMTPGAVKTAAARLRQRYRELLRAEIAETVGDEAEVDDEIRSLFAALAG